jgi:uncharacterized HAD superfamily protein
MKFLPLGKKLTIAIDVDGTIAHSSDIDFSVVDKYPNELAKAKPIKEALKAIRKLHKQGYKIVFYTSRSKRSKKATEKWLKRHGFPYHHIEMEKFVAHVYIDDRAINGCNWKEVAKQLKRKDLPGVIAHCAGRI